MIYGVFMVGGMILVGLLSGSEDCMLTWGGAFLAAVVAYALDRSLKHD